MIFAANVYADADLAVYEDHRARGYDFLFGYNSGYAPAADYPSQEDILEGQCGVFEKRLAFAPERFVPTASCFSDTTPRRTEAWMRMGYRFDRTRIYYATPDTYRQILRRMKAAADRLPETAWGRRMLMIDNWNEWDEGHFVAPSHSFGFRYLEAIREELTARDNLPDYRMPQDLGFTGYNRTWGEPDLTAVCKEKFHLS